MDYKIVIVEDEPPILGMLKDMFSQTDYPVTVCDIASNGRDGLKAVIKHSPDILITDIRMPFMNGLDLIKHVNTRYPNIRCIILSGYSDFEYARSAVKLRVYDYLIKPILPEAINQLLEQLTTELKEESEKSTLSFLQDAIYHGVIHQDDSKRLFKTCKVYLIYAGTFSKASSENTQRGNKILDDMQESTFLEEICSQCSCYLLHSHYLGERIIIIDNEHGESISKTLSLKILKHLKNQYIPINIMEMKESIDTIDIVNIVEKMNKSLQKQMIFGESHILEYCEGKDIQNTDIDLIKSNLSGISSLGQSGIKIFRNAFKALLKKCQENHATQLQLVKSLQNFMDHFYTNKNLEVDMEYIIESVHSYNELYDHICFYIDERYKQKSADSLPAKELVHEIEDYLGKHYQEDITYRTFKNTFAYNEVYITNVFKELKGITPSKYLTQLRIKKAKEIMRETPAVLLKDVASMVGYQDPLYFSRVFKNHTGESPSKYIKRLKNE